MRVLIIDDDPDLRQTLLGTLTEEEPKWEFYDRDFDGLDEALSHFRPDMLVLDLLEGQGADGKAAGNEAFNDVWKKWFCPIVVYSAFPDEQSFDHSLVEAVTKGANTELTVGESPASLRRACGDDPARAPGLRRPYSRGSA